MDAIEFVTKYPDYISQLEVVKPVVKPEHPPAIEKLKALSPHDINKLVKCIPSICALPVAYKNIEVKSNPKVSHLIKGDVLPTVSTRDKRRKSANVWTSGNRIFKVNNPKKFVRLLDEFNDASNTKAKLHPSIELMKVITELEKKEYNNYLEWLYHEMERQID